jgi:cell division protein FtsQ
MVVQTKDIIRRERKRKVSGFLKTILFLALLVTTAYILIQSPLFTVQEITVENNKFLKTEEIVSLSGLHTGTNIFRVDFRIAKQKIKTHPMVDEVEIKRVFPDEIRISLLERKPLANLVIKGGFIEIDEKGYYLRIVNDLSNNDNLPIVSGVKYKNQVVAQQIKEENLVVGLTYLKNCSKALKAQISEVNVSDANNVIFYSLSGFRIIVGDDSRIADKVEHLDEIIKNNKDKLKDIEYIDVSFNGDPVIKFNSLVPVSEKEAASEIKD